MTRAQLRLRSFSLLGGEMHQETLELAELKAAHALTPYPSDFEAFWKARMEEADNAPLSWQIVPSTEVTSTSYICRH